MADVKFSVKVILDEDGNLSGSVRGSMFSHKKKDGSDTFCACAVDVDPDLLEDLRDELMSIVDAERNHLGDMVEDERAHIRKLARTQRELEGQEA